MKKVYEGRIIGLSLLMFIAGALGHEWIGNNILLLTTIFILLWIFSYDLATYEVRSNEDNSKKVMKHE